MRPEVITRLLSAWRLNYTIDAIQGQRLFGNKNKVPAGIVPKILPIRQLTDGGAINFRDPVCFVLFRQRIILLRQKRDPRNCNFIR